MQDSRRYRNMSKDNSQIFECKFHHQPIIHMKFDKADGTRSQKFKFFCEECIRELEMLKFQAGDSPSNFITTKNLTLFDDFLKQLESELEYKQKAARAVLSSFELTVESMVSFLNQFKEKIKGRLTDELSVAINHLSKIKAQHKQYHQLMDELLKGSTDENALQKAVDLFSDLSVIKNTTSIPELQIPTRTQEIAQWSKTQLMELRVNLEDLLLQREETVTEDSKSPHFNDRQSQNFDPYRPKSVNDRSTVYKHRRIASHKPKLQQQQFFESVETRVSTSPVYDGRESLNTSQQRISYGGNARSTTPTRTNRSQKSIILRKSDIGPLSERRQMVFDEEAFRSQRLTEDTPINCHQFETNMKNIDTMVYISELSVLVYAGPIKGEQHHSLVFYKMDKTPTVLKVASAHTLAITSLHTCPEFLISCSKDAQVKLWNLATLSCEVILKHSSAVLGVTYYSKKKVAFTYGLFPDIRMWNLNDMSDRYIKIPNSSHISRLYFIENREWLIVVNGNTGQVCVLEFKSGDMLFEFGGNTACMYDEMEFDVERNLMVTVSTDGALKIWNFNVAEPYVEKTIVFKYKGGLTSTNSFVVDFKEDLVFITNSNNNFWVGKLSDGVLAGFLNWIEVGVKNIHRIIYVKRRQWILAANKNNGKIAIVDLKQIKSKCPVLN